MTIVLDDNQWQQLEARLVARFHGECRSIWTQLYRTRWADVFPPPDADTLDAHAAATWRACLHAGIETRPFVMALHLQVWRSAMLGLPDAFIDDLRRYVLEECQASDFGFQWVEHVLRSIERYLGQAMEAS